MLNLVVIFIAGMVIGAAISQVVTSYCIHQEFDPEEDNLYDFAKYCKQKEDDDENL